MRVLSVCLSMLAMMKVCGAEPAPVPVAVVAAPPTFTMTAQHGGTVVQADDHWVEVVPRQDGTVEAYVVGPAGAPPPPTATVVTARVPASDRRPHDVTLAWSPEQGRYEGRLVGVRPAPGPVEVVVIVEGRPRRAIAPHVVVLAAPPPAVVVDARPRRGRDRTIVVTEPAHPGVVVVGHDPRPGVVVVGGGRHDRGRHLGHYGGGGHGGRGRGHGRH